MSEEVKKKPEKDFGEVIFDSQGHPICSEHGYTLWISEKSMTENAALCLYTDEYINAATGIILTKTHLSVNNIPDELDYLSGVFHKGDTSFG